MNIIPIIRQDNFCKGGYSSMEVKNIADVLADTKTAVTGQKTDHLEPMNIMINHSTMVRILERHRLTKEDNNKIIDDAINYYLDNVN